VINVSNHPLTQARGNRAPSRYGGRAAAVPERGGLAGSVLSRLSRLASFLRRLGDRWFAVNDTEAFCWRWQITKALGGLSRRYRDARFDTLAACARCAGARAGADAPCTPCLGTGRITLGEVS
jgi:hypothetical protein